MAALKVGDRLGHYHVTALIGEGGMGQVYRAADTKLGRDVALKVLPPAFTRDSDRLARFRREAMVLASLNHPNIAAIHGLEESESQPALVLELVEGPTLAERIAQGPIPIREALRTADQVAAGLEAAHDTGVIHRDLKPDNVKLGPGGTVKILDFGLAKAEPGGGPSETTLGTSTIDATLPGTILGTVTYMSPEQMRGQPVDHRADVWAFGCCLFELLTGRSAFGRATGSETIAAVLDHDPDWSALPRATPSSVVALLRACLDKDPNRRVGTLGDVRHQIALALTGSSSSITTGVGQRTSLPRWALPTAALLVLGTLSTSWLNRPPTVPRLGNAVQVTAEIGVEDSPSWAPDGETIAFAASATGNQYSGDWDIFVQQLGGGAAANRTRERTGDDRFPSWSPDGRSLAFWSSEDGGGYYVLSALGGRARRLVRAGMSIDVASPPRWTADSSEVMCVIYGPAGATLMTVHVETSQSAETALPGQAGYRRFDLASSPDGRLVAYVVGPSVLADVTRLWVLNRETGEGQVISDGLSNDRSPSWSADGRRFYFVSNRGGNMDLWQMATDAEGVPRGTALAVTTGIGMRYAAFSPTGAKLAYSQGRRVANVWRLPIPTNGVADWSHAEQITYDQALIESFDLSADGAQLLLSSDRLGNQDVWTLSVEDDEMAQFTFERTPDWAPRWSADGQWVAFYAYRTGNREVWTQPFGGGAARQLTSTEAASYPAFSQDGSRIVFQSLHTGNREIYVTGRDGGEPRQLTFDPAADAWPIWTADDRGIIFSSLRGGTQRLWTMASEGGAAKSLTRGPGHYARLAPDGVTVYYTNFPDQNIWAVRLDAPGEEWPVTALAGRRGSLGLQGLATDGRHLFFSWEENLGDIWVMDVESR